MFRKLFWELGIGGLGTKMITFLDGCESRIWNSDLGLFFYFSKLRHDISLLIRDMDRGSFLLIFNLKCLGMLEVCTLMNT